MKRIVKDLNKLNDRVDEAILSDETTLNKNIQDLKDALYGHKNLVCLSAPQIGVKSRIFCIKFSDGDIRTFINPMITHREGLHLSRESSPSIPDKEFIIPRNDEIQATYQTPVGKIESNLFQGVVAEVFQQMIQSLDGIMLCDYGLEVVEGWDESTQEERDQVIDMYMNSLKEKGLALNEEIQNTPDLKKVSDAIDFMTSVAEGKTILEHTKTNEEIQKENQLQNLIKQATIKDDYRNFIKTVSRHHRKK